MTKENILDIEELKLKIEELNIPKRYYSINGSNTPNTYVLQQVYSYWEYYYVDERGGQNNYHRFDNESAACRYFFEKLEFEMRCMDKGEPKLNNCI